MHVSNVRLNFTSQRLVVLVVVLLVVLVVVLVVCFVVHTFLDDYSLIVILLLL